MPRFMVMTMEKDADVQKLAPSATKALVEGQSAYVERLRSVAAYVDGERLRPSSEGRRVSHREGQPRVDAGSFGDEALTAYCVLEAEGLDAAVELAREWPTSPGAEVHVRPLMKGQFQHDKASQQGRVFAYAVLGSAPNEEGWIEVMDRIDESTREGFPSHRFLGGVRLQAPGRGRRLAVISGRRAILDGPFLESKEVIGGLFFLRMASVGEAVDWALGSEFVKHGVLEVRELWRS